MAPPMATQNFEMDALNEKLKKFAFMTLDGKPGEECYIDMKTFLERQCVEDLQEELFGPSTMRSLEEELRCHNLIEYITTDRYPDEKVLKSITSFQPCPPIEEVMICHNGKTVKLVDIVMKRNKNPLLTNMDEQLTLPVPPWRVQLDTNDKENKRGWSLDYTKLRELFVENGPGA